MTPSLSQLQNRFQPGKLDTAKSCGNCVFHQVIMGLDSFRCGHAIVKDGKHFTELIGDRKFIVENCNDFKS